MITICYYERKAPLPLTSTCCSWLPSPHQASHWTFWTPICRPPLAPAAGKLYHSSLLSPNSASHSNHVGLPNRLLPLELLVFPASLAKLACRLKTQCWWAGSVEDSGVVLYSTGYDGYTAGLWGNESNYHNFPFFFLCVNSGDPAVQILHMLLSMQTSLAILRTSSPFPSQLPHTTHSHFIISTSK